MVRTRLGWVAAALLIAGAMPDDAAAGHPWRQGARDLFAGTRDHVHSLLPSPRDSYRLTVQAWRANFPIHPGESWVLYPREDYPCARPDFKVLMPTHHYSIYPSEIYVPPALLP
jgi:hypothetical protein